MAMQFAPVKLAIPPGWERLLSDFSREVLRQQPAELYAFAATYFRTKSGEEIPDLGYQEGVAARDGRVSAESELDYEDPALAESAKVIQSNFRGYTTRKELKAEKAKAEKDAAAAEFTGTDEEQAAAAKIQAGFRGHQTRKSIAVTKTKAEMDAAAAEFTGTDEEQAAAAKIQAGFRGHQTRKSIAVTKTNAENASATDAPGTEPAPDSIAENPAAEDEAAAAAAEFTGTDEEQAAAAKIQAGFRGHQTRKSIAVTKSKAEMDAAAAEFTGTDEEQAAAAKIQAGFRGHQTRKSLAAKDAPAAEDAPAADAPAEVPS